MPNLMNLMNLMTPDARMPSEYQNYSACDMMLHSSALPAHTKFNLRVWYLEYA